MTIVVNGSTRELDTGCTVSQLLAAEGAPERGIAVAVDGVVVPRVRWSQQIHEGAQVEIVTAVQGG